MKIKDFIYGTLPRKNKKNKKKGQDHVTINKKRSRSRDLNKNCGFFPVQHNRHLVSEDFQYKDSEYAACNISYQLEALQSNVGGLSQDTDPVFAELSRKESTISSCDPCNVDGNFNTLPRIRSRIKTNPWLPSPKTSPAPSGTTSPMTSSTVSNHGMQGFFQDQDFSQNRSTSSEDSAWHENSESGFFSTNITAGNDSFISQPGNLQNNNNREKNYIFYPGAESIDSTDRDSLMQSSFLSEECNDLRCLSHAIPNNPCMPESRYPLQIDYESEFEEQVERQFTDNIGSRDDVFSVFNSRECLDMDTEPEDTIDSSGYHEEPDDCRVSDDRNSIGVYANVQSVQRGYTGSPQTLQCVVNDDDDDDADDYVYLSVKPIHSEGPEKIQLIQPKAQLLDSSDESSECRDFGDELHKSTENPFNGNYMKDSPEVSPTGSLSFDLDDIEFIDADPDDVENNDYDANITPLPRQESDHGITSLSPSQQNSPARHTTFSPVASVQSSLRDKVRQLKQDKEVVDGIVRKAREEQRLRKQELLRIQKQAALARKQILLKTLMELREKLDHQTDRLQSAYNNIVTFRYNEAVQRRYCEKY